ncbi:MAG: bifunctional oligoribonuclease/PAP phosphatase NrnA [Bacilli bacterium]|nr:bifunctional oligoribonuclease/PAP phosphatase NrnA [Bacilli bacterium]MDD4809292.1 bifunctional oligoribonuclease/PAP phosphatase NrnA [Bacilli bacterium]
MNKYNKIYRQIKKYKKIVIARHIGPDPDSLASSIALRDIILNTFPNKEVYAVGAPASTFKFLGVVDKFNETMYENALVIILDTPDAKRVDGVDVMRFKGRIKIDHHPFVEEFCDIEWIDETASSACQMVLELTLKTRLKMTKAAAEKLFVGIVSDTNRFLFQYTTPKTFMLVSKLIKDFKIDFANLYEPLYLRPIKEIRFQGYIANNMIITENGFAHITITEDVLKEYNVDAATAGNMINNFNYINEVLVWAIFSVDVNNDVIRGSIRSRGPIINEAASRYGGGGHVFASGVRLRNEADKELFIKELDETCLSYKNKSN